LKTYSEKLVDAYANGGYYTRAFAYADSLKSLPEYEEKMILKLALLQLDTASAKIYKLLNDSVLMAIIQDYASDSSKVGYYQARAVLKQIFNNDMQLIRLSMVGSGARLANTFNDDTDEKDQSSGIVYNKIAQSSLNIFPNPTNGNFKILYSSSDETESSFYIRDILGKQYMMGKIKTNIAQEINTDMFNNGIYFITLIQDQKLIDVRKIIIMK